MSARGLLTVLTGLIWAGSAAASDPRFAIAGGDAARGRALIVEHGCRACHVVPGIPGPHGRVGPDLAGLRDRAYIAGQFPNRPGELVRWLVDPPLLAPETAMPALGLSQQEARDIATFLYAERAPWTRPAHLER